MTKRIGRYEILAELGHGGFGRVFRGLDPTVGRQVAVKTLIADGDAGMLTRFRNEAAASGRLRHPNIVTIYDFGEHEGVPYIVMELLEGRDLQHAIEEPARMPLSLLQKIQIMTQIASGLGHAHASGIIHRDVKPANVMLLNDGSVKIMDFGIALVTQGTQSRVTPRGAMIGTFRYMAPEQFKGAEPNARSDIFSYGLIFYELLAGVHPFHAPDAAALMYNILSIEPVSIGEVCPDIPRELQDVVMRILMKDPDMRYQSLDDVLFDMQPALLGLRTTRARELVQEALLAKGQNQLDSAQTLVREALELAPGLEDARQIREEIQAELRRQTVRPRVENLLQKGREALAAGNPAEAVERFESAIRLDPVSAQSLSLLQEARAAVERSRETARLVAEAEKASARGDVTGAARLARQALTMSPGDHAAQQILDRAEAALAQEQRKVALADALSRARRLIGIRSWDEASTLLSGLAADFPENPEVAAFSGQVRAGRLQDERERHLSSGLSEARKSIQQGDLPGALATLDALSALFSESKDVQSLLRFVHSELEEKRHRETVQRSLEHARASALQLDFAAAARAIEEALSEYPADASLQHELRAILAEQKETARRAALAQAVVQAGKLRTERKFDQALASLDRFVDEHGADSTIAELREGILADQEAARRTAELRDFIHRANDLLAQGQPEAAATLLQGSPEHFRGHPEITRLLNAADGERQAREERQAAIDEALSAAAKLGQQGKVNDALASLSAFRNRYGEDPRIEEARLALERTRQEADRAAADLAARATALIPRDPAGATAILNSAPGTLREYPAVREAGMAAAKAEQEKRSRQEAEELAAKARELARKAELDEALRILEDGRIRFPGNPEIDGARGEINEAIEQQRREALRQSTLTQVRDLLEQHRYADAELAVASVLAGNRDDEVFQRLRREVETRRQRWLAERAEQEVRETLEKARSTLPLNPAASVGVLESLSQRVGERSEISALLVEARDAVATKNRRERIAVADMLCERQEFDAALAKLKETEPDSAGELAGAIDRVKSRQEEALSFRLAGAIHSVRELRDRDPRGALRLLENLPPALRNRPELEPEIQASRAAIAKAERAAAIAEIEEFLAKSKFSKARARQKEIVARFGSDAELQDLLARIEEAANARANGKTSPAAEGRPSSRKPIWLAASVTAAALVILGVWSLANRPAAPVIPSETAGNQTPAQPQAVSTPQPPVPAESSIGKEAPEVPTPQNPAPQTPAKESSKAAANPAPTGAPRPVQQEPKSFVPPKSTPEPSRPNNDKGETTIAVLPPQLPPAAPPPGINTPAPAISATNPPPPAAPANSQPAVAKSQTQPASEAPAIEQVLAQFGAAFKRKDFNTVSSLWPNMPNLRDYRKSFADSNYEVRQYTLEPQSPPDVQGDRAQVSVRLTANFAYKRGGGTDNPIPSAKTVFLEKKAGKWVITAIR